MVSRRLEGRSFRVAITASVLIHLSVFAGLYNASFQPAGGTTTQKLEFSMEVALTRVNPQREVQEQMESPETTEAGGKPVSASRENAEEIPVRSATEREEARQVPDAGVAKPAALPPSANPGISPLALRDHISAYMGNYARELNRSWLEECVSFQERYGKKDCPRQNANDFSSNPGREAVARTFASLSNPSEEARRIDAITREKDFLEHIMAENSALADVMKPSYALARDTYEYLTGDVDTLYASFLSGKPVDYFNPAMYGGGSIALCCSASSVAYPVLQALGVLIDSNKPEGSPRADQEEGISYSGPFTNNH